MGEGGQGGADRNVDHYISNWWLRESQPAFPRKLVATDFRKSHMQKEIALEQVLKRWIFQNLF